MRNDYLWDGKGDPDPEIEGLEEILGTLKYKDTPLVMASTSRRRTIFRVIAVAATIVITCTAGLWWLYPRTEEGITPVEPVAEAPDEQPLAFETPTATVPAIDLPGVITNEAIAPMHEVTESTGLDLEAPMVMEPIYEDQSIPILLTSLEGTILDTEDTPLFTAGEDLLDGEVTDHLEHTQLLLQSFKNVQLSDNELKNLDYEKQRARALLTDNMLLRRDTHASGDMETSDLLNIVETYLLDIANLQHDLIEAESIKNRIQRKEIIVALQIRRN